METEIELKYLVVNEQVVERINNLLDEKKYHYTVANNTLTNCYFDTKALSFRKHDFGLRVRSKNEQREQTIKTAGQTIGGLHKRPEYNIDITDNFPDLSLFPDDIWPKNTNLAQWQDDLIVLFSTDFVRHTWTITYEKSVIELAFDVGSVSSSGRELPICEIELELLSGEEAAIFSLAQQLSNVLLMRPGTKSKAARGYQLWHNQSDEQEIAEFPFIPISGSDTCESALINGLTFSLSHLQKVIDSYFNQPSLSLLSQINHGLLLMRHAFWLFDDLITDEHLLIRKELSHFLKMLAWQNNAKNLHDIITKQSAFRKKIEYSQKLVKQLKLEERRFPSTEQVLEMLMSSRFNQLQLSVLQMILAGEKGLKATSEHNQSIFSFCASALEKSLNALADDISFESSISAEQYLSYKRILNRSLLTGSWCGQLFDDKARADYRAPWLDIMHGITELETLCMLKQQLLQLQAVEDQPEKLVNWLECKIENLLTALDASRQMALVVPPYWRS